MKTYLQLVEEIVFEAGGLDIKNLESATLLIIEECLAKHTSQIRYDDLFTPDTTLVVSNLATGKFSLPTNYQHLDLDSVRILPSGDVESQYSVAPLPVRRFTGVNTGIA